ncbi:hypothetical protein VTK56DRAFT_531 [Thermocarpiscus australiensis]
MKNWRELGEVPDSESDDESFDDAEVHEDQLDQLPEIKIDESRPEAVHEKRPEDVDIWRVPSSSPEYTSPSRPAVPRGGSPKLNEPSLSVQPATKSGDRQESVTAVDGRLGSPATPQRDHPKIGETEFLQDEISTGYVRVTTPGSGASSPASLLSKTPTPPASPLVPQNDPIPPRHRSERINEGEELSRQTAVRLERSLRPRKPIQQHPYLLENAQYTTFMKKHGVKPIKVVTASPPARRTAEEEDSQDKEFQMDESQEASGESPIRDIEESGPILFDDEDELALTPSLPKTSSPGQHLRLSSPQTNADHTDATSLSDDEELPPLERLIPLSSRKRPRTWKRQQSRLRSSAKRKRPRVVPDSSQGSSPARNFIQPPSVWDLSPSPPEPEMPQQLSQEIANTTKSPIREGENTGYSSTQGPASTTALLGNGAADSPVVINEDDQSEPSDDGLTDSSQSFGSDSDVVRRVSRKIRGVLPASWLRLDRQKDDQPVVRNVRKSPGPPPNGGARRGVALPKQGSPKPSSTAPLVWFDESEDSDGASTWRQVLADEPAQSVPVTIVIDEDDAASVLEDDSIDLMLPGRKRAGSNSTPRRTKKQKHSRTQPLFTGDPVPRSRQPKITQVLSRSKHANTSTSAKGKPARHKPRNRDGLSAERRSRKRAATPTLLSILDVMEPGAPDFVRIAARAVKRKANLGKASPSKKLISLATRSDNVDARSALRDWKSGKTKPRIVAPSRQSDKPRGRPALREISVNAISRTPQTHPQKLVRQSRLDAFVTADNGNDLQGPHSPLSPALPPRKRLQDGGPTLRPAQLEVEEREDRRRHLTSRKRTLDAFYRRSRRMLGASTDDGLDQPLDVDFTLRGFADQGQGVNVEEPLVNSQGKKRGAKSRFRKRRCPQYVDVEAPQYARANDPLPADFSVSEIKEPHAQDKLQGLAPFGAHYTNHFEIFPLDRGTYFHESTVLGRGCVRNAAEAGLSAKTRHQRPAVSFSLDGRVLRWGAWDDNTSSELGILTDWVAEQLSLDGTAHEATGRKAVEAADFVLGYILRSLSVQSDLEEKAFVSRCLEVFSSFTSRFESVDWTRVPEGAKRTQLEVAVRFSVAILAVRSLSYASGSDFMQTMRVDDLLKKCASVIIGRLLACGTEELRTLYGDLQRFPCRERGIRSDRALANCWAVMIRVLENAAIPRSSFWDVTQSVMLSHGVASCSDARVFERLWQDMFTLLPLCEIDNSGILVPGLRNTAPLEGWTLPQQLLKRVFELYKCNPRQPPAFNDYCRALVARCHFLVQQWGWRKCTGIIGTIFDFFGTQNLAHLRNEEVYKSPRFLEELDSNPSLSIEPEDRCFHIFIKLLALTIRRLREFGRLNDIRNLVARTLPNHNRQYLKEDTVHQHDLAALRNHHDLLCTLFWVSPPELRPAVHLIEKLVVPGSAHKEACLINVRAWNQLGRFVISNGEYATAFKPLAAWRNNVFNQILDQYLSAASDIEQQFRALSREMPGISKDVRDDMIAKNKATALGVLHFSVKASLDVLQRAPNLEAALCALNTAQLQKVFTAFDFQSPRFDWSLLRVALDTLGHFMDRIDRASEEQYSSEFSDNIDSRQLEEAVLLVNEHLTKDFFWMSRTTLALPLGECRGQHSQQAVCTEKTVTLAARIAARFIKNRVTQLSPYFSVGKYGLFPDLPKNLNTPERRYLPLFLASLVKNHIFDFRDIGINILGLWIISIAKPQRFLGYEHYLAEVLQHHNLPFVDGATVAVGIPPDYNSNIDFFACAIHYMRRTLRESGSTQSKQHRDEFSKILQLAMQKMKEDLVLLRPHAAEHGLYIEFVRQVISLIKSHGVGICVVDPFFTQPSVDYSPPVQDPLLHTAGIVAYGVRLSERDVTAVPQLFHYLYNNFKIALGNDKLEQECRILGRAMQNAHVTSFILQFMIPAVIQASAQALDCWALLEVYTVALGSLLDGGCVPRELADSDVEHAAGILDAILAWFEGVSGGGSLSLQHLHIMALLATVANLLQPSLTSYLFNESGSAIPGLQDRVDRLATCFAEARSRLEEVLLYLPDAGLGDAGAWSGALLSGLSAAGGGNTGGAGKDPRVQDFAKTIISDVRRNWVVSEDCRVLVRMASGRGAGGGGIPTMSQASSLQGARYAPWTVRGILERLCAELGRWELGGGLESEKGRNRRARRARRAVADEELLF